MTSRTLTLDARLLRYLQAHGARETAVQSELRSVTQRLPQAGVQRQRARSHLRNSR